MNGRDDEAWLDTLLQRQLPSSLSDEGFQQQLLQRLPPRERKARRVFILVVAWLVAAAALLLPTGGGELVVSSVEAGSALIPSCLGAALLWYLVDRWG
jgi:anti-sigma factor RsiW